MAERTLAGEVIRSHLARQLEGMLDAGARVRLGEPESIHDMRIAVRRIQATLRAFRPLFDEAEARGLDAQLAGFALELGVVRDSEVLLQRLLKALAGLPAELVIGPVHQRLRRTLRSETDRGLAALEETMAGAGYVLLLDQVADFVAAGIDGAGPASKAAGEVLPRLVARQYRKLARRVETAAAAPVEARAIALHQARKSARKLRYAAEAVAPVYGCAAMGLAAQAQRIQETLGEHQDSVVASAALLRMAGTRRPPGQTIFTLGVLVGVEQGHAEAARSRFGEVWKDASAKRHRAWLR